MISNTVSLLEPYRPFITANRDRYLNALTTLPEPFENRARGHYLARLSGAEPRPLLGEYIPYVVAELLDFSDRQTLADISTAWMHIYLAVMLLDDVIDSPDHADNDLDMILVGLLLQRGLCRLFLKVDMSADVSDSICAAFTRNASAVAKEISRKRERDPSFSQAEVAQLGDKFAVAQICVDALGAIAGVSTERQELLQGALTKLLTGLQLLDDLTDLHEDYEAGSVTLPIAVARERNTNSNLPDPSPGRLWSDALLARLLTSGAIEDTLQAATDTLQTTLIELHRIKPMVDSPCFRLVGGLVSLCGNALSEIREARLSLSGCFQSDLRENHEALDTLAARTALQKVRRTLILVAQSS